MLLLYTQYHLTPTQPTEPKSFRVTPEEVKPPEAPPVEAKPTVTSPINRRPLLPWGEFDPNNPPLIERTRAIPAIRLDDGRILYDQSAKIHAEVMANLNIPHDKVIAGGIITPEGKYIEAGLYTKPTSTAPISPTQPEISAGVKEAPTQVAAYHDLQGRPITKEGVLIERPTTITGEPITLVVEKPIKPTLSSTDIEAQMENRITDIDTEIQQLQKKLDLSYSAEMEGAARGDVRDVLHRQAKSAATREINKLAKRYGTPEDIQAQITTLQNERADILKQAGITPEAPTIEPTAPTKEIPFSITTSKPSTYSGTLTIEMSVPETEGEYAGVIGKMPTYKLEKWKGHKDWNVVRVENTKDITSFHTTEKFPEKTGLPLKEAKQFAEERLREYHEPGRIPPKPPVLSVNIEADQKPFMDAYNRELAQNPGQEKTLQAKYNKMWEDYQLGRIEAPTVEPQAPTVPTIAEPTKAVGKKQPWEIRRKQFTNISDDMVVQIAKANNLESRTGIFADTRYRVQQALADAHKEAVRKALAEGQPVPPEVLADYPDLQVKPTIPTEATEGYRETRLKLINEYQFHNPETGSKEWKPNTPDYVKKFYNDMINEQSQPVPDEVLTDYPDLQKPSLAKRLITEEKGGFNFFTGPQLPKPKDPLAARVHDVFEQADTELAAKRATTPGKIKAWMRRQFVDVSGNLKAELESQGVIGKDAVMKHDLALGSSDKARMEWNNAKKSIYSDLSPEESKLLDRIIQARRNIDISRYKPDVKHPGGLTGADYQAYIDSLPPNISQRLQPKADAYFSIMKDQLTQLYDNGLLSDDAYNALITHDYEPRRFIQYIDPPSSSYSWTGNKITVPDSGIKALDEGSERMLENNSGLMLSNVITRTQARIFKNEANKALYELATKQPGNGIVEVSGPEAAPGGFEKISVMIDGEQHQMLMPSVMAKEWVKGDPALNRTQAEIIQWITGGKPLKMMATGYNPAFAVSNIFRDAALAQFATEEYSPFLPKAIVEQLHDYGKVFGDVMLKKGRYIDYVNEGGGMDFLTYQGNLGYLDKTPIVGKPLNALGQLLRFTGERSELLTRIALRERAIANGATAQEATYIARNYIDFSQGGQTAKFLDNFLPYFNAGIQGTRGVARAAWRNPAVMAFKFAQVGALASGIYYANTRINKEAWNSIPDRDKEANWIITTPYSYEDSSGNKRWVYFKIPVEQSIRLIKTMFEAGSARVLDGKMPTKQVIQSIKDSISIFPNNFLPPTASAIASYMTNYDFWRNDKIWKGPEVKPSEEYTPRTSPVWAGIGKATGLSPERSAVAASQVFTYSNPIATMVGAGMKELMDPLPEAIKAKTTTEILTSNPSVRRFMSATPPISESLKQRTQELGIEENTRRYRQSREIDSMLMRLDAGELHRPDIISYIKTQPPLDRQRLFKRMQHSIQIKDIPDKSWWLDAAEQLPEARAKIFAERFNQADPEERKRLTKTARRIPGFLGGRMGGLLRKELVSQPQRAVGE